MDAVTLLLMLGAGVLGSAIGFYRGQKKSDVISTNTAHTALAAVWLTGGEMYGDQWWDEFYPKLRETAHSRRFEVMMLAASLSVKQKLEDK